jgi:hypothetical protein
VTEGSVPAPILPVLDGTALVGVVTTDELLRRVSA